MTPIGDAVIDLVGNQANSVRRAIVREIGKLVAVQHGAGRIGGGRDDEAVDRPFDRLQHRRGPLEVGFRAERQRHHLDAERLQDVPVSWKRRLRHHDPITRIEGCKKAENETARCANRHRHPLWVHGHAVSVSAVFCDHAAKGGLAEGFGIAERAVPKGALGGFKHPLGRSAPGLADFHMHDIMSGCGLRVGGGENVHREKSIDRRALTNFASMRRFGCLH